MSLGLREGDEVRVTLVGVVTRDGAVRLQVSDGHTDSLVGLSWLELVGANVEVVGPPRGTRVVFNYRPNPQGSNAI